MTDFVRIVEVGPRDGLQNEKTALSIEDKVEFIDRLSETGLSYIESGSFVSPKWVPQMASSDEVFKRIKRNPDVCYAALTPNLKGYSNAHEVHADEVAIFAAASEGFSQKNINCSIAESIERFRVMCEQAKADGVRVRGYVSCIFACPYDGTTNPKTVIETCEKLFELGCYEVSLGDTIGVGTAFDTKRLLKALSPYFSSEQLALHLHDTYGQALASVYAGLEAGIRTFDGSVAGLGGCPYAKGATGNLATEDLIYLVESGGMRTEVDLEALIEVGNYISKRLDRPSNSNVAKALSQR